MWQTNVLGENTKKGKTALGSKLALTQKKNVHQCCCTLWNQSISPQVLVALFISNTDLLQLLPVADHLRHQNEEMANGITHTGHTKLQQCASFMLFVLLAIEVPDNRRSSSFDVAGPSATCVSRVYTDEMSPRVPHKRKREKGQKGGERGGLVALLGGFIVAENQQRATTASTWRRSGRCVARGGSSCGGCSQTAASQSFNVIEAQAGNGLGEVLFIFF